MVERSALGEKSCTPCRGGVPALTSEEASTHQRETPEWELRDDARRIERRFKFKNFAEAFAFVQRAGHLAEGEGHHPDISFGWGYAEITVWTHKIEGLTESDFIFAAKVDVDEELTRLRAHLDEVDRTLRKGGAVGKRLDFMAQELNREANTLASKAASPEITDCAMELKLLIEQMREQVQNIE